MRQNFAKPKLPPGGGTAANWKQLGRVVFEKGTGGGRGGTGCATKGRFFWVRRWLMKLVGGEAG